MTYSSLKKSLVRIYPLRHYCAFLILQNLNILKGFVNTRPNNSPKKALHKSTYLVQVHMY